MAKSGITLEEAIERNNKLLDKTKKDPFPLMVEFQSGNRKALQLGIEALERQLHCRKCSNMGDCPFPENLPSEEE